MTVWAERYFRSLLRARGAGLSMTESQAQAFMRLLETYAEELSSKVATRRVLQNEREALRIAREIIRRLSHDIAWSTRTGVNITAERVAEIYARATAQAVRDMADDIIRIPTTFGGLGARAAEATLTRGRLALSIRSIRLTSTQAVDEIILRALVRGATSSQLARELRVHLIGAAALPEGMIRDRRTIGYEAIRFLGYDPTPENLQLVRAQAGKVAAKAELIARTEIMAAEHEAHIQVAIDSPIVRAIRWKTSSRHPKTDVCDVLAAADLYGLGPGIFDPRLVPPRPHPRCICIQEDILVQSPAELDQLRLSRGPLPQRRVDVEELATLYELAPSEAQQLGLALAVAELSAQRRAA